MAKSKIRITFSEQPIENTSIDFTDDYSSIPMYLEFDSERNRPYSVKIGSTINETILNYVNAFNSDYNNNNSYSVSYSFVGQYVDVAAISERSFFSNIINDTNDALDVVVTNIAPVIPFTIDNVQISEADINPCENVKITVTTNEVADIIQYPFDQPVSENPFSFNWNRANSILVGMRLNESSKSTNISVPLLLASYFKVNNLSTPSGLIVNVSKLHPLTLNHLLTFEYSLDDMGWQTSSYFSGLTEGDHIIQVRDNIGCSVSIPFTINAFAPNLLDYDGVCEISNLNSIRYKQDVEWNEFVLRTPENTLSFEENVSLPNRSFTQRWTKNDIITTQIKSNYENITAKLIDSNNVDVQDLVVSKRTENMNVTDVRDALVISENYNGNNYVMLKFNGGKTYNPLTLLEELDYNLGVNVPSWMNAEDYVNIQSVGWFKVIDIVWSEDSYVVVLNLLGQDFPLTLGKFKITSVYNLVNWESYEFATNFNINDGYYKIEVNAQDDNFGTKKYTSEWQQVKNSYSKTFLIDAYNSENNEINYGTGIRHRLRIPFVQNLVWKTNTEQEIYTTDTKTVPLKNKYRGFWDFSSVPLPTVMAEKLALILLQDRLFIDTVSYVVEGDIETVNVGNQYQIKANLVKSDYVYESGNVINLNTIEGQFLIVNSGGGLLRVD